jgi:hypothetical protein
MMLLTRVVQLAMVSVSVWALWYMWRYERIRRFDDVDRLARQRR